NEGDSTTLTGSFADPGTQDAHTVDINWGDGSADTTLPLDAGTLNFSADHTYQQNPADGSAYTIQVTVSDADGASTSASSPLTVANVAPANLKLGLASTTLNEGDTAALSGMFTDPGALDGHTVTINWGDGSEDTSLTLDAGVLTFGANHQYQ